MQDSLRKIPTAFCILFSFALIAGCGAKGDFPTAKVEGTVKTADGKPIEKGKIKFSPLSTGDGTAKSGKPAVGRIKDGAFELTTYGNGDGAVVGQHDVFLNDAKIGSVTYTISPDSKTQTVSSGSNVLELTAVPVKKRRNAIDEDEDDD